MKEIIDAALRYGAENAAEFKTSDLILSPELRATCEQNTCRNYGSNWMCPPGIGDMESCIDRVKAFENGVLIQIFIRMKNSFDMKAMMEGGERLKGILVELNGELKQTLDREYLILGAGGCRKCEVCAYKTDEPCRHPEQAFSSVEAHGIYVSDIIKKCGLKYTDGPNTIAYVAMVLY